MSEKIVLGEKKEFHPVTSIFPMIGNEEFAEFKKDIEENGLLEAIWLDQQGSIIDGRNRYRACSELGIQPTFQTWDGKGSLTEFVVSLNLKRRHLNTSQKACVALAIEEILAVEAKERQREALIIGNKTRHGTGSPIVAILPQSETENKREEKIIELFPQTSEKSRDVAARYVGIGGRYVSDAKKLKAEAPEVFESVASGKLNIQEAKQIARLREPQQLTAIKNLNGGKTVKDAISEARREMVKSNFEAFKKENGISKQEWWGEKLKGLPDHEKFEQLDITFQPYDVWNFNFCHDLFGSEHPGRIPGQLVMHVLAFYTNEGDTVIDPMAGSGTVVDACVVMGRKCYAYDIDMRHERFDIIKHDIARNGWTETLKEADLIFWDAPYYCKKDKKNTRNGYIEGSISGLSKEHYLKFFFDSFIEARFKVKPKAKLAFLMSDFEDLNDNIQDILLGHYWKLIEKAGWRILKHIQAPLPSELLRGSDVIRLRANKRMGWLNRYLLIAEP